MTSVEVADRPVYVSLEEVKATLTLTGSHADQDVLDSVRSASQAIDDCTHRRFWLGEDANEKRVYYPDSRKLVLIDDLDALASLEVDTAGDLTFTTTLASGTDFILEPLNAVVNGEPYCQVRRLRSSWSSSQIRVTGRFGWPAVPAPITDATRILAVKLFKRKREAPFGIVTIGAEAGVLMRLAEYDPDVGPLIRRYIRPIPPA